jgi:serine/threonine protein kinase
MRTYLESCRIGKNHPIQWNRDDRHGVYNSYGEPSELAPFRFEQWLGGAGGTKDKSTLVERVSCINCEDRIIARKLINCLKQTRREHAMREIKCLKLLRHPHIVAFVGTYLDTQQIGILLYPAAQWNLEDFMEDYDGNGKDESLLLRYEAKRYYLRRYFLCLSNALKYLHDSQVRHKDLKPKNILIDAYGNVLLSDFGISRQYRNPAEAATLTETYTSYNYSTPEFVERRKRGPPSDVFALGIIFAEMATLVLGRSLKAFQRHRSERIDSSKVDSSYHKHLIKVHSWLSLILPRQASGSINGNEPLINALPTIIRMLSYKEDERPTAATLWESFKDVNAERCPDCDPREQETVWSDTPGISDDQVRQYGFWDDTSEISFSSDESEEEITELHTTNTQNFQNGTTLRQVPTISNHLKDKGSRVIHYDVKEAKLTYMKYQALAGNSWKAESSLFAHVT